MSPRRPCSFRNWPRSQPITTVRRYVWPAADRVFRRLRIRLVHAIADGTQGAGTSPPTIGRAGNLSSDANTQRQSNLVPVEPPYAPQNSQQAAIGWDPWEKDPWSQTPQAGTAQQTSPAVQKNAAISREAAAEWQRGAGTSNTMPGTQTGQLQSGFANNQANVGAGTGAMGVPNLPPVGTIQAPTNVLAEQPPWLPLLVVSLSLVGSLSANLFLGWSYIDARQKYRSLVRKTADTFRRVANGAAA